MSARKLRKIMTGGRLPLIMTSLMVLAAIRAGMRTIPFATLLSLVRQRSQPKPTAKRDGRWTQEIIVWSVDRSADVLPGISTCLARALAANIMLANNGYRPTLQIGVAVEDAGKITAHAWVEIDGKVVIGALADMQRYAPFSALNTI